MTEAEWKTCTDPRLMVNLLRDRADCRKWRLFAVASCSSALARFFCYPELEYAVACGERNVDEPVSDAEWRRAWDALDSALGEPYESLHSLSRAVGVALVPHVQNVDDGRRVVTSISDALRVSQAASHGDEEFRCQSDALRCIFGNPFNPIFPKRAWFTTTVVQLAEGIYADRAFDRLPILADALQDAGCENEDLLTHCRNPGPHACGCWVVDLLLGKS